MFKNLQAKYVLPMECHFFFVKNFEKNITFSQQAQPPFPPQHTPRKPTPISPERKCPKLIGFLKVQNHTLKSR